jgi:L-2-hydroxyglutarate oxidase
MREADLAIIGGGIVGLATAYQASLRHPGWRIVVLEKEASVGAHQSGHNSGVLHSGIYYVPGSLKAINCRAGKQAMEEFCREHEIPYDICGKVIVAVGEDEVPRLMKIFERGQANGVRCEWIGRERLKELEPHAAGVQAIHVPEAGIVNYRRVCEKLAELIATFGGEVLSGAKVTGLKQSASGVLIEATKESVQAARVVNCTGLHSDRIARLAGEKPAAKVIPFRGEYFELKPSAQNLCRNLLYPTPDPRFPFLGVHFTRMIEGGVECGPNAVLAFAREGYNKLDFNLTDLTETLMFPGFLRFAAKYWYIGLGEMWRSWSKAAFVQALQRLIPEVRSEDLLPHRAGVRAQNVLPDGSMVDDFLIQPAGRIINVLNAPSPAATSSLNIGRIVVDRLDA